MAIQVMKVGGMTCGGCAKHLEKALRGVEGVSSVTVDLPQGTASVEGTASLEAMTASVTEAGYQVLGLV